MKLHLPILLRRAVLAVMAALAASPAMAAETIGGTDAKITRDKTYSDGVSMEGMASNRISGWSLYLVGGGAKVTATSGNITLTTVNGYNAIANDLALLSSGAQANAQKGNVIMDGPANVVAFGSTVTGQQIIMQNTGNQTIEIGTVASGLLGDLVGQYIPDDIAKVTGNFNIVQGSTVGNNNTALVTMDAATANLIVGGTTVQATDIKLKGGASAIVNADLGNLLSFAGGYIGGNMDLNTLLEGGSKTTLNADNNINMGSQINVVCGGEGVELKAGNAANFTGAFNVVGGNTTINAREINLTPTDSASIKDLTGQLSGLPIDLSSITTKLEGLADQKFSAGVVAGGSQLTAEQNITTGGTFGLLVNTKVTDVVDALMSMTGDENPSEMMILQDILASGTATTVTSTNGNIKLGSQFNVLHGGNLADSKAALTITANNGTVNMLGTANVVSGNTTVTANGIKLTGERLPSELNGLVTGLAGSFADKLPGGADMMNKLIQKGTFNIVTGGATLTAGTGGITMNDVPVDSIDATGAINAVLDTQLTDLITVVRHGEPSAILPTTDPDAIKATTTLSSGGNIDMLGRVNVVAGLRGNVDVDAVGEVNLQGNISMVAGNVTVDADSININTSDEGKYKMHLDSSELGMLPLPGALEGVLGNMGMINAAVVAGGAELTAQKDITTGGTVGVLLNTPMADVIKEFNPLSSTKNPSELEIVQSLLQKGTATTITSKEGSINLGSQLNLAHGGGFTEDGANALTLTAKNGAVNMQGTGNVVSGNVVVEAKGINMMGERLPADMAGAAGSVVGSVAGMLPDAVGKIAGGMLDKLVQKGSINVVTGGATLTAGADGITMSDIPVDSVGATGAINAVLDTDLAGVLGAMTGDNTQSGINDALIAGGSHQTTLKSEGDINMLGRVNVVNGGKVVLDAKGNVNLQGSASLISGGATVTANNININTDGAEKYKMYFDSTELGGLVPEGSPFAPIVNSISGLGLNAAVVTGGAELTATGNINTGGTLGLVMNMPISEVFNRLGSTNELWEAMELLNTGVATTVTSTNGNINLGSQLNLVHGGNFTEDGANVLTLTANNGAVNVQGTFNVVSGNTQVTAQEINMTGVILPADMAGAAGGVVDGVVDAFAGDIMNQIPGAEGLLDRLIAKGNGNIVTGGATLTATGEKGITMSGAANAVIDTNLSGVLHAFMTKDMNSLVNGGNHLTTLTSAGNIDMQGRLNVVNGAYVKLDAAKDVNLKGTVNVVSGKATVEGNNINLVGQQNLGLDWETMLPGDVGNYMDQMGITNKLDKGINGNLVLGGAKLNADNDITISGMASVVTNTPVGSAFEALNKKLNNDWYPELWLVKEVLAEGIATTLNAENGSIIMDSRLNVLHGGNFAANGANALALTAGKDVKLDGTLNMVSGNVTVDAQNIELKGGKNIGLDLSLVVDKALGADYTELAKDSGMIDKIANKGLNANIVTGGATLNAKNDITMNGMANAVLDTDLVDVVDFVEKGGDPASLVEGGNHMTTLKSGGNIDMQGRLNVVNGAYVTLDAAQDVNLKGTVNVVSGKATVKGNNINIVGQQNVGLEWGELIPDKYAGYAELADKMGILDKVNGGVNGSVIAGGAKVTAESDININGMAGAVVDTTMGSVMEALQNMIGTPLLEGETEDTTLTAGGDINMNTRFNVVNGGKTLLDAGKDVNLGGTFNVVATNANVKAKGNINMTAKNKVGVDISHLLNGHYAELAEEMGMTDVLKNGVSSNVVTGGAKLNAEGDVVMSGVATAIADTTINNVIGAVKGEDLGSLMQGGRATTTVTAKNDIKLESQLNVVNGGNSKNAGGVELNAGRDVIVSGDINVVNRATVKAGNNVDFGGDLSVVKYSDIDAATVSFTGKKAEITDVNFNTASVEVIGTTLVNTAGSEVAIKSLDVELGNIENLGTLELDAAALAGSTLHNEGSITVNSALTLNSATLSFVADSNNSTLGSTAITLGDNGSIAGITTFTGNSSADMIAGVSFLLNYDALEFIDNTNEFAFELAIFQGATEDEWSMLKAAIANDELSLTLNNGYNVESINSLEVVYSENGGIVSLKGTASVPEPTTATLSLLALAALAARRRRR